MYVMCIVGPSRYRELRMELEPSLLLQLCLCSDQQSYDPRPQGLAFTDICLDMGKPVLRGQNDPGVLALGWPEFISSPCIIYIKAKPQRLLLGSRGTYSPASLLFLLPASLTASPYPIIPIIPTFTATHRLVVIPERGHIGLELPRKVSFHP